MFKTIVYSGTSTLLNEIQDELKNQNKNQAKVMLSSLGIGSQIEVEKDRLTFQEEIVEIGYQKAIEIQDLVQEVTSSINRVGLDFQQQRFQQEKVLQQQLIEQKRAKILQLAAYQRETTLLQPEIQKIFDFWPLKLLPIQLLESRRQNESRPLRIFIAPPKIRLKEFEKIGIATEKIECRLAQGLREFLSKNYSLHSQVRPTEFLGGAWESKHFYGEASIKALFWMLKSEPTLILESEFEGDYLYFRMAYWGLGQEKYCYETIFKLSCRELIEESVKTRAIEWKETEQKLLALGKNPEEIRRLGGTDAINLAILEEVEQLQRAGIDTRELAFEYQVSSQDFEALCQFLTISHCLVAGWVTDIHYLVHCDLSPLLPELLPQLIDLAPEKFLQQGIRTTVSIYQEVFQALAAQRPYWMPELALKLAQSLTHLSDKSLATEQIDYSLKIWLQQRQLSSLEGLKDLEAIESTLTRQDREYLENLKTCFLALGDEESFLGVQSLLTTIAQSQNQAQGKGINFALSHTYRGISGKVASLAITTDSRTLISIDRSNTIELWDLNQCQPTSTSKLKLNSEEVLTFAISPDGQTIVSSDNNDNRSHIKIWHSPTGKLKRTLFGHKKPIRSLALSLDGQILASGSHKIKLWNLQTGEPFQTLFGHKEWVHCLAISSDGRTVISGSEDKSVRIWNVQSGELNNTLRVHQGCVRAVAISSDRQIIVSASEDKTIALWDYRTGKLLRILKGHEGAVSAIAISPDGQYLFSGSEDKTIKIWHLNQGELLQTLNSHEQALSAIALSSDGKILASGSLDHRIEIWRN
ncbi:MAG: WD40 repeat domain-containing protein [Prochloraceae cyanobacterium]